MTRLLMYFTCIIQSNRGVVCYSIEDNAIIECGGIPVAAIVPMHDYAQLVEGYQRDASVNIR